MIMLHNDKLFQFGLKVPNKPDQTKCSFNDSYFTNYTACVTYIHILL